MRVSNQHQPLDNPVAAGAHAVGRDGCAVVLEASGAGAEVLERVCDGTLDKRSLRIQRHPVLGSVRHIGRDVRCIRQAVRNGLQGVLCHVLSIMRIKEGEAGATELGTL